MTISEVIEMDTVFKNEASLYHGSVCPEEDVDPNDECGPNWECTD